MTAEQEFFLYELETTDSGSVGLVLRLAANLLLFCYPFKGILSPFLPTFE